MSVPGPTAAGTGAAALDRDRTATEPIPVQAPAASSAASGGADAGVGSLAGSLPIPTVGTDAPGRSPGTEAPIDPASADPKRARKALARAARERRRYERQEVRRFTARSRRRRLAWLVGAGSVVVVSAALVGAAYSPLMALREVRIEGAQRIPAAELQAAFAPDLGTPLPLITSADVREALSDFALVETYSTETLPPGTLVVRIVERTPVGVVETDRGLELVDAAGVVIDRPAERPEGEPLIDAGGVASEGFRAAAAVMRSLPPDVRPQVVRATAETADDVRLELASGASVIWGSGEQSRLKATVLAGLMAAAPPDTVPNYYDVSAPMSAVIG
ncbi:FtsQ-type POTRA domain-containing protein [Agromyces sp. CFH 90414]|uniref:FtsQ-type POTRA domain-containing protein n=1 Tax=Agromyces agglutinans TaxID=2662258 RepID=A0A6I2FBK1_9MICO|nr:FtsQ-type POTRA domain-containing protein [Agromyces agglutinans]MRG61524.1 FtsQ-type POTRA domain-containing protein [Agromyces agglutinans]